MNNNNHDEDSTDIRLSKVELRLSILENHITPSQFKKIDIVQIFPIHHNEMPEDVMIFILACLSKEEYLTCKLVCKKWDAIRHSVAVKRKEISTPPKVSFNYCMLCMYDS